MELQQIDPELERFDRHRVREIRAKYDQTAAAFLAEFQSTAASLEPDERIKLVVLMSDDVELIKAVLADPQANRICSLKWWYKGKEDVSTVLPLLISSCPELASLEVCFKYHSEFDFVSSLLEHPSNKIKELEMPKYAEGDIPRFFAALGQSQVSALNLSIGDSPEFAQGLYEYLAKDLLVKLKVRMGNRQVPSEMMMPLAKCTRLAEFKLVECKLSQPTAFAHLPKSITKLVLHNYTFVGGFDWSFLTDSNVRELGLDYGKGLDGNQLGDALAAHLRAKGLDELCLRDRSFADEALAAAGVEIGRIKRLDLSYITLDNASLELIALVLQSPNSEMKELTLWYDGSTASSIEGHLVSALRHPNCNLAKLSLQADQHKEAAGRVNYTFRNRLALFVLLQGKKVRRRSPCPLRRLPVEMFRLVGAALI